ncbi:MAG: glycosyltransferase family 4 protein [Eubacterium sp.]|nr:glycosyltransferase family 4 protein [Eubacterium sp.]
MRKAYSVYVRNADSGPACYYRIVQYVEELERMRRGAVKSALTKKEFCANLNCADGIKKKLLQGILYIRILRRRLLGILTDLVIYRPETVVIQRELIPRRMPLLLGALVRMIGKNADIIWDFDDDIFESGEISRREKKLLLEQSSRIIVVSTYLKQLLPVEYRDKVTVLPTTEKCFLKDSQEDMLKRRKKTYAKEVSLIWAGTSGNLRHLSLVINELDAAARRLQDTCRKSMKLVIVCNRSYQAPCTLKHLKVENISWSRKNAQKCIRNAHIAIMPLMNTRFAEGKGGFKLVQCMASGIPAIASDVGYNREIVNQQTGFLIKNGSSGAWEEAVCCLAGDKKRWEDCCSGAYEKYRNDFNFMDNLAVWEKLLIGGSDR